MNKKFISILWLCSLLLLPAVTHAQGVADIVNNVLGLVKGILWSVSMTLVIIAFVLAGFKYLNAKGDPSAVSEAHKMVIWGLVGTVVIILAWSMTSIVGRALGF